MARRGSTKDLSVKHEDFIAQLYGGERSQSSGAAATDQGDVRLCASLVECKYTGSPATPLKSKPKLVKEFEKITVEAWSEGRDPLMALRFYCPDSPLANPGRWVDFSVRLVSDDAARELAYVNWEESDAKAR